MFRNNLLGAVSQQRLLSTYKKADTYAIRAQQENLRTRAAYKLDEINQRFNNFLCRGANVVDLGASPGGFSLIAARNINVEKRDKWGYDDGSVPIHVELKRTLCGRRRRHGKGDITDTTTTARIIRALGGEEADVVVCDVAPSTTGDVGTNHVRSIGLAEDATRVARGVLRNGGTFCVKVFQGGEEATFKRCLEEEFVKVKAFRPAASRKGSREVYYIASGFVPEDFVSPTCEDVYDGVEVKEKNSV